MEVIIYTVGLALLALIVFAFLKANRWLSISTVIIMDLLILLREHWIGMHARSAMGGMHERGELTEEFANGVRYMVDYCDSSSYPVLVALLVITVLCFRGFRDKEKT